MNGIAVAKQTSEMRSVRTWLSNPFHFMAGWTALGVGVASIGMAGEIARRSDSHFDGVLDFHTRFFLGGPLGPFWLQLAQGLIGWLCLASVLYLTGKAVSKSRFRGLDVFGTQALARFPSIISALAPLVPGTQEQVRRFAALDSSPNLGGFAALAVTSVLVVAATVWMVMLMYRAYAVSCNVSGTRGIVSFTLSLLVAEVLSKVVLYQIFNAL